MSKKHSAPDNQNSLFGANGVAQSGSSGSAPTPQREASSAPDAQGTYTFDAAGLLTHIPVPPPKNFVVFDVETRRSAAEVGGWNRADRMGVSVAVAYDSKADDYFSYQQEELPALFERLRGSDLVVGFNSLRFDYAVLSPFAPFDLRTLPSLDLLQRVYERLNYRLPLDNLGQATLGEPKSADGLQALQWWKEGRLEDIATYCRKDVDITRRLYLHGLEQGFLLFSNKAGSRVRVPVDFHRR